MPSVDVKWPSEDEEFDTVATATAQKPENKTENNQDGEAVPVNIGQSDHEQVTYTPEVSSETQTESSPEPAAEADIEAEKAPEAAPEAAAVTDSQESPELNAAAQAEETPSTEDDDSSKDKAVAAAAPAAVVVAGASAKKTAKANGKGGKLHFGHVLGYVVLIALVAGLAYWAYGLSTENKDLKNKVATLESQVTTLNNNPAIVEQRKTNELVTKVSALMEVPQNESPQAALVSDASSLKKQYPFFANVTNGDQILFYYQAGKVIVYRPSTNKIVQTGPLTISQTTTATTPAKR
jgi:hypothetical protein